MAQLADSPATTSSIASWFDYLTAPAAGGSEVPTPDRYVLAAVLGDETIVKIDDGARWYPVSRCYRSDGAKVELDESTRGSDDVYTTDSGVYRVLTAAQYAEIKGVEAARAEAAANAAVSSPRATRAPTPTPMDDAMARLSVSSAPTGCGAHARMVTVLAVGPTNIRAALRGAAMLMEQARKANNEIVTVVLGAADAAEADAALRIDGRVILLAGANELTAVLPSGRTGPMRAYLRRAVLLECVAGSARGTDGDGNGGTWLMPVHPIPLDALPANFREPRGERGLVAWKDALNATWREWFDRFEGSRLEPGVDEDMLAFFTSLPTNARHPPLRGLCPNASALIGAEGGAPFGVLGSVIQWSVSRGAGGSYSLWPEPAECWASTGRDAASVHWAVSTWCGSMRRVLRAADAPPAPDGHTDEDELQADVEKTLVSLLTYEEGPRGDKPFLDAELKGELKGLLGPVVMGGRNDAQPMRASWWTVPGRAGGVLMLLPEAYVRIALEGYAVDAPTPSSRALLCTQGLLAAPEIEVPMRFDGVDPGEYDAELVRFGKRLWLSKGAPTADAAKRVAALDGAPRVAAPPPTYRMQRDAEQAESSSELRSAQRVPVASKQPVWMTMLTTGQTLSNRRVRWVRRDAPPHLPTLDVDTFEPGGAELPYERF